MRNTNIEIFRRSQLLRLTHLGRGCRVGWLTGKGPREHHFKDGDAFTKMLQKHDHIQDTRGQIVKGLTANKLEINKPYTNNYKLGGLSGVSKYIRDYSTLMTGGLTGNLAVTFLGSYGLKYEVLSVDEETGTAQVHFYVSNSQQSNQLLIHL